MMPLLLYHQEKSRKSHKSIFCELQQFDGDEGIFRVKVIFARFVNHANHFMLRGFQLLKTPKVFTLD